MFVRKLSLLAIMGLLLPALLSFLVAGPLTTAQAAGPVPAATTVTNQQIVFTLYNATDLTAVTQTYKLTSVQALQEGNTYTATVTGDPIQAATNMNFDGRVAAADPNYDLSLAEGAWTFDFDSNSLVDGLTNPLSLELYHTQSAWSQTNLAAVQTRSQGAGVTVAVLDTGVDYNHPNLQGHLLNNGYSPLDGGDGMDVNGHGTFVAGLIAWVAPQAKILPVRILDADGHGTLSSLIDGIEYAVSQGATILNLSFSTTVSLKSLQNLAHMLSDSGVAMLGASGNDNTAQPNYPAALDVVVGLGATDQNGCRASFSNYGDYVALAAPGVNIYSTYKGGGYAYGSGTSFSTAILSGAATLYKSLHPRSKGSDVKNALKTSVSKYPGSCHVSKLGTGQLDFSRIK